MSQRGGHYYMNAIDLRASGIPADVAGSGEIQVDSIPQVQTQYDSNTQRLLLNVPPHWLPNQQMGRNSIYQRSPAQSSFGALASYDLYSSSTEHGMSYSSLWSDLRVFGGPGLFSTSGLYRHTYSGGEQTADSYIRYDTRWIYSNENHMLTYELGDLVSNAMTWSSPVRIGGVQISRDFSVRPDVVTYPLPQFSGEAAVPSTVDLFVNGYKSSSSQVDPGPFSITNVPFINGAGEAVVVTTDALGRQVSTTLPFYVTSSLLKPGLSDFSLATGTLRQDYGQKNFSYGAGVASGSYRYGVNDYFTFESHAEGANSLGLGGLGGVFRLGNLGTLNTAYSRSQGAGETGGQTTVGYQYNSHRFSFGVQQIRRDNGYSDLSVYGCDDYQLSSRSTQANASVSLGELGSIGAGYFDIRSGDDSRTRLLNLSWSKPLWGNSSLYLSANREIGDGNWSSAVQLVIPFDVYGTFSSSITRSTDKQDIQRVEYSSSVPSDGGLGWNLGYANNDGASDYRQAGLTWRGRHLQLQGGINGTDQSYTHWADVSGSLVFMDGSLFASNQISDAFVVVSTDGQPDIPVRYENQLVGETDAGGRLLVPWASAYYAAKYEIDPLNLDADIEAPDVEKRVAVKRGSGYLLRFAVGKVVSAYVTLHDTRGKPLPLGSLVTLESGANAYVGWDGLVYLEKLQALNRLAVQLPEGGQCQASFTMPKEQQGIPRIDALECL
ncbi:F1 capsule-anchoring protein [compost metagenome]